MEVEANATQVASDEEVEDVNKWLPITSARKAKWWYSTFHNVTAMVGAGVLSLPYAMSLLGWGPGVVIMLMSWLITLYTLWQMVEMHEIIPGRRLDRYHELGQAAFGKKLGLWLVVPQQLVVEIGVNIVYMVTGGKSLKKIYDIARPDRPTKLTYFTILFGVLHLFLSHLPNFDSIAGVSLTAAVMSLSYSTIAWAASLHKGMVPNVSYGPRSSSGGPGRAFEFLSALGDVAFAFAGHNVVLEIQAGIPSTPENPSKKPMWRGVIVAYIVVAVCYFPVAFIGYALFGNTVEDNILVTLEKPAWVIIAANLFVVIHVIGSYQIYAMAVFDMIESYLVINKKFKPSLMLRIFTRTSYVAFTLIFAIIFPFFGALLSFIGGLALAPTTYYLPCIIWLALKKPRRFGWSWWTNWICIVIGVLLTVLAPIGALRMIIYSSKTYKFFS